jgi:hypothetical protein
VVRRLGVEAAIETAPMGSFAQIVASARHGGPPRAALLDRERFVAETLAARERLEAGGVPQEELERAVAVFRLVPLRMESLTSSEHIWERWEWARKEGDDAWGGPSRLLPY